MNKTPYPKIKYSLCAHTEDIGKVYANGKKKGKTSANEWVLPSKVSR